MKRMRALLTALSTAVVMVAAAVPAAAAPDQTFEDDSWNSEEQDGDWAPAIEAVKEAHPYLADLRSLDMSRTALTPGYVGRGLRISIPEGGYRGFGPYARLPNVVDQAWFRYMIRLDRFHPVSSGKLPGLADASRYYTAKGCNPSTESAPGWSGRLMFDQVGTHGAGPTEVPIGLYLYHLGQEGDCGDELMFDTPLQQNRWTCIEGRVRMNTPGSANGLVEVFVDGERVLRRDGVQFRRAGESDVGIREMWDNVYFGGSYSTPTPLGLTIDEIKVLRHRVGCSDPFVDDNDNIHREALTELFDRGLLKGCGERIVCPSSVLTRAQFAAMVNRVVSPPAGPDAFVDDEGHYAEASFNALAAAGIVKGCNPPANTRVCPEDPVTRAEVAAIVQRALDLPPGPDVFGDDEGHWGERAINAIAAAGITKGCDEAGFCPERTMVRGEAASFTVRVDDLLSARLSTLSVPDLPEWPPAGPPPEIPEEEQEWPPGGIGG